MKKSSLFPTSPVALRFAAIMHRQPTTPWNEKKEINNFRALSKQILEADLELVERYYKANWPPKTNHNHLRHDLATLINNWSGEVDRARIYCESHPLKTERKIIEVACFRDEPPYAPSTDPEEIARVARFEEQRRLRKQAKAT